MCGIHGAKNLVSVLMVYATALCCGWLLAVISSDTTSHKTVVYIFLFLVKTWCVIGIQECCVMLNECVGCCVVTEIE